MSYCYDFIKKFKKEGNFCGLDKSEVSRLEAYVEILGLLEKHGLDEKFIIEHFTVRAARPLIAAKEKDREDGLNYVTACLKRGETVTTGDLQSSLHAIKKPDSASKSPQSGRGKLDMSNSPREKSERTTTEPFPVERPKEFTGLRGVHPSTKICEDARCPSLVLRGGGMARECKLSSSVPGNTPICPLDLQFYYQKYPITAACRKKHCEDLILQRPDLHLCKITGMRPENHTNQKCPKEQIPEEVPPAPIAQTLKEKYGGKEQPALSPGAQAIYDQSHPAPIDTKAPCLSGQPCPDVSGQSYMKNEDHTRGKVCSLWNLPLNQLPKGECPILLRQKKAQEQGFVPAGDIDPTNGARFVKLAPVRITKAPMEILFKPSPKQQEFVERMVKTGEFETPEEVVSAALDTAMLQEGGA